MKFLTKEWYDLCQQTGLHFGMRVHNDAHRYDDGLYERLYKRKEKQYIKQECEIYNLDPRRLLHDGIQLIPLHKVLSGEVIEEEDMIMHHMSAEERARIEEQIAEYDARPPFDEAYVKQQFRDTLEFRRYEVEARHPKEILSQVADVRVYVLGYCTKEIFAQLRRQSKANEKKIKEISKLAYEVRRKQSLPESTRTNFNFHDCRVTEFDFSEDFVIRLDTSEGFTNNNKITFIEPQIIMQEEGIVGSHWLYDEIYQTEQGFEVHALLSGAALCEMIVSCKDIVIEVE